jgi:hypothetical protein
VKPHLLERAVRFVVALDAYLHPKEDEDREVLAKAYEAAGRGLPLKYWANPPKKRNETWLQHLNMCEEAGKKLRLRADTGPEEEGTTPEEKETAPEEEKTAPEEEGTAPEELSTSGDGLKLIGLEQAVQDTGTKLDRISQLLEELPAKIIEALTLAK